MYSIIPSIPQFNILNTRLFKNVSGFSVEIPDWAVEIPGGPVEIPDGPVGIPDGPVGIPDGPVGIAHYLHGSIPEHAAAGIPSPGIS